MGNKTKKKIITAEDVRYVAKLSRLSLDEDKIGKFQEQLDGILGYIAQLDEVNTDGVLPTTHVLSSMKNVFREDELRESLTTEAALKNAPEADEHFFKVPKII